MNYNKHPSIHNKDISRTHMPDIDDCLLISSHFHNWCKFIDKQSLYQSTHLENFSKRTLVHKENNYPHILCINHQHKKYNYQQDNFDNCMMNYYSNKSNRILNIL